MPPDPPSNSVASQCNGATYTPAMLLSFLGNKPFSTIWEEECLSHIYLLDLTEVKQAYSNY